MRKSRWIEGLLLVGLIILGGWAYQTRQVNHSNMTITAVGSTALQPLVEAAGEDYSTQHLGTFINVQGGGSGTGLSQVQEGAVDIGNADVFAEEQNGINANRLKDHRVAVVGITPIVNRTAGVHRLTSAQLIGIFTGKVLNWSQVGGRNQKIVILNRAQGSGTRATFERYGLEGHRSLAAQEQDSSGMVRQIVATTPGAISYVGFSYVDKTVQAVSLNGVKPTNQNVTNNRWPIWSYEHMYTGQKPQPLATEFIHYIQSKKIQNTLVRRLGYISMADMKVARNGQGQIHKVVKGHE
ncbi:phosphate ABC transporter substrate-binding protein PstS family protein [Secundilactobacillus folii]|uniref:Phosphate-binding protein n=1 Tax=Secundilactobacillus folii TaxID=2678357 RepID=A0A7X2XWW1_9LACO|nr:phosphate ABC transporter substrate-binding protein PstS family protein [Secundilactobacillus folii]MTV82423.1 phosphate ABC transporter substrate-binding protein PstS family protein [Secundilactobacillus folii]